MAWTSDVVNGSKRLYNLDPATTLSANGVALGNASVTYSDAIDVGSDVLLKTMGVMVEVDDSPANNIVFDLYASATEGGTYTKVADDVATGMTGSTPANGWVAGTVDLSLYPFSWFKIAFDPTGDESSNHVRIVLSQVDVAESAQSEMTVGGVGADPS